jgi:uncharacterized Zn-binding protein involved in type VI secretion
MALKLSRLGDTSNHGGVIITASSSVMINGKGAVRQGDLHSCPLHGHGVTPMTHVTATTKWTVDGRNGINEGDQAQCGAAMVVGSPDTFVS